MEENNESNQNNQNINTEELKNEVKDTVSEVKQAVKDTNLKNEANAAKNFFSNFFKSPFTEMKKIVESPKAFLKIAIIVFVVWVVAELIGNLPIIKMFNKSGGLIFGVIKGFVIAYAILAILSVLSPIISQIGIISAIQDSTLGSAMYNNNILLNLFF